MTLEERLMNQWEQQKGSDYPAVIESSHEAANNMPILDVVPGFAISLTEAKTRVQMLQAFISDMMVAGIDYGYIPGCPKPSLLKPGAEKLCDIFGFSKQMEVMERVVDWEKGVFAYEVKAVLVNKRTGLVETEGLGSCNSLEKKYRQQDGFSVSNTILKMAKKRALVDAVLSATRSSAIFTQDIEDMDVPSLNHNQESEPLIPTITPRPEKMASDKQLNKIFALVKQIGMPPETASHLLRDRYGIGKSKELTMKQASDFIQHLMEYVG